MGEVIGRGRWIVVARPRRKSDVAGGGSVRAVIVMGVSGSGKTTVGEALSAALGWEFVEGDRFHPRGNIEKLSRGEALSDADRGPWLAALRAEIESRLARGGRVVVACSALKRVYREVLRKPGEGREIVFVYLRVPRPVIEARVRLRRGHFASPALVESQFRELEEPVGEDGVVWVQGDRSVGEIVADVRREIPESQAL